MGSELGLGLGLGLGLVANPNPHPNQTTSATSGALSAEEAQLGGALRAEQPTGAGGSPAGDKRPIDRTENAEGPARKR